MILDRELFFSIKVQMVTFINNKLMISSMFHLLNSISCLFRNLDPGTLNLELLALVLPFLLTTLCISLNCSAHHRSKPVLGVLDLRAEKTPLST